MLSFAPILPDSSPSAPKVPDSSQSVAEAALARRSPVWSQLAALICTQIHLGSYDAAQLPAELWNAARIGPASLCGGARHPMSSSAFAARPGEVICPHLLPFFLICRHSLRYFPLISRSS